MHILMAKIAHDPLHFGEGFGPEPQTRTTYFRKTTNVADAIDQGVGVTNKSTFNLVKIIIIIVIRVIFNPQQQYKHPFGH